MSKERSQKMVIYLDQNWLSDITKAVRLDGIPRVDKSYFTELYEVILRAIAEDKIVCPTSPLHMSKSNFDSRRNSDSRSVDNAISGGLSFNPSEQTSHNQLLEAVSQFTGVESSAKPGWRLPFNRDPDVPVSMIPRRRTGIEVIVTFDEWVNEERRLHNQVGAAMYRKYKETRKAIYLSYQDEVKFSRCQLFREGYSGITEATCQLGETPAGFGEMYRMSVLQQLSRLMEIQQICETGAGLRAFMCSDEFHDAPYLTVRAKLMAADIVYHNNRNPESSLLTDFAIAATVAPYVDVFATENYLAELLRRTGVAGDYGCDVCTMRQ